MGLDSLVQFELPVKPLLHIDGIVTAEEQNGIPFSLDDYLEPVDFTGRCIQEDKRGAKPPSTHPSALGD